MDDRRKQDYLEDKKYIHETLKHTAKFVEKLDNKFDEFKLETATTLTKIQTKMGMYIAGGSIITGVLIKVAVSYLEKT